MYLLGNTDTSLIFSDKLLVRYKYISSFAFLNFVHFQTPKFQVFKSY